MSDKNESVPAVVLAGGKAKPDLLALTGQANRALAVVNGKTLLRHVTDALRAADSSRSITVVGDVPNEDSYACLPDHGDFTANLFAGLTAYAESPHILVATSDLPFLDGDSVAAFEQGAVSLARETKAVLIYPVVPVAACYARFPGVRRTSLKLREGAFTGGNLVLANPASLLGQRERIAAAYAARKSPLRLARMLGLGTLCRLPAAQMISPRLLTVAVLEARVSRLLGCSARAIICDRPEIATDLDRASDFAAVGLLPEATAGR